MMRKIAGAGWRGIFAGVLVGQLAVCPAGGATHQWGWIDGVTTVTVSKGEYGELGVGAESNTPGRRSGSAGWSDSSGDGWIFGGTGTDARGLVSQMGDLWKYDAGAGQWIWMHGTSDGPTLINRGSRSVEQASNTPGSRLLSATAAGGGALWLFGGHSSQFGYANDLWRINPANGRWTWVAGGALGNQPGVYGVQGTGTVNTKPGSRIGAALWVDTDGDLWLYGGTGFDGSGVYGVLGDLWKYDVGDGVWTWMKGASMADALAVYGTQGEPHAGNEPGGRSGAAAWSDPAGDLWVFGGMAAVGAGSGTLRNDLWKYSRTLNQWSWVGGSSDTVYLPGDFGTLRVADGDNLPPGREGGIGRVDSAGRFWLFGGDDRDDLWMYDPVTTLWTWMDGSPTTGEAAVYDAPGAASAANAPGARNWCAGWMDLQDRLVLFGGDGHARFGDTALNDLWSYDPVAGEWTWIAGSAESGLQAGVYGVRGTAASGNRPGPRRAAATWTSTDKLWLFGGGGNDSQGLAGLLNDMWKYDRTSGQWTWVAGSNVAGQAGLSGAPGEGDPSYAPAARQGGAFWTDSAGRFWLFGGSGQNDLWRFDPAAEVWTMVAEGSVTGTPEYGTKSVPHTDNLPGGRTYASAALGPDGTVYLFGGSGCDSTGNVGPLNDLWTYDMTTGLWTWISGSNVRGQDASYGSFRSAGAGNRPGAREGTTAWVDELGRFWLFGGLGHAESYGSLNELWRYDPATTHWAWMNGSSYPYVTTTYLPHVPGSSYRSAGWKNAAGILCLFGGADPNKNELWFLKPDFGDWGLVTGNQNPDPVHGAPGVFGESFIPGNRERAAAWSDEENNVWVFGGDSFDANGVYGPLNDLWSLKNTKPAVISVAPANGQQSGGTVAEFVVEFDEAVEGFEDPSDVTVLPDAGITGSSVTFLADTERRFRVFVQVEGAGSVGLRVNAGAAADVLGLTNEAAESTAGVAVSESGEADQAWQIKCDAALVCAAFARSGSGMNGIFWGSVLARGNMQLIRHNALDIAGRSLTPSSAAYGAGISNSSGLEKWLRWQAGGSLLNSSGSAIFPPTIDGISVTDFFSQLMNGEFSTWTPLSLTLGGVYSIQVEDGEGIYYDAPVAGLYPVGSGALVQNSAGVISRIDELTSGLDYALWKERAIRTNGYMRPATLAGDSFVDADGNPLYVSTYGALTTSTLGTNPLTRPSQISMRQAVPADGNTYRVGDRVMFIDTLSGTEEGARATVEFRGSDPFFWKGLIYANADVEIAGSGAFPAIRCQNPDHYAANPTGESLGYAQPGCMLDGLLYTRGLLRNLGSASVYGAIVSDQTVSSTRYPTLFYNSRLKSGLFRRGIQSAVSAGSGQWHDNIWDNAIFPEQDTDVTIEDGHVVTLNGVVENLSALTVRGTLQIEANSRVQISGGTLRNEGVIVLGENTRLEIDRFSRVVNNGAIFQAAGSEIVFGRTDEVQHVPVSGGGTFGNVHLVSTSLYTGTEPLRIAGELELRSGEVGGTGVSYVPGAELLYPNEPGGSVLAGREWPSDAGSAAGTPSQVTVGRDVWAAYGQYAADRLTVTAGCAFSFGGTLTLGESLENYGSFLEIGTAVRAPGFESLTNAGTITTRRSMSAPGPIDFGLTDVQMDAVAIGTGGDVDVIRTDANHPQSIPGTATGRYWEITTAATDFRVNLTLPHNNLTDPFVCRYEGAGQEWEAARTAYDTSTVTRTGVTQFSTWAAGDAALGAVPATLSGWGLE